MPGDLNHPLFARFFDRLSRMMEPELGPMRKELLDGLQGRVLELGAGNGANFAHYPSSVQEVVAVEPEPYFRAKATEAAERAAVPVRVQPGLAGELEFDAGSFDAAVCSLVLCSVPDQETALADLRRSLRPGGELRFLEHVLGAGSGKQRLQRGLDRSGLWPRMAGGCHCSRDTVAAVRQAGFDVQRMREVNLGPGWAATNPHVLGVAVA